MKHYKILTIIMLLGMFMCSCTSCEKTVENSVKVKAIRGSKIGEVIEEPLERKKINDMSKFYYNNEDVNYVFVEKIEECEFQLTIYLDNPEAYGIDSLRIKCDDEDAEIMIDGLYKPIAKESDGSRVINWASEDPYEKTFYIKLGNEPDYNFNIFEITDIRLAGHELFLSKETNSFAFGNNLFHIYKIDYDILTKNVISIDDRTIRINYLIKEEYKDNVKNIRIDGESSNSDGIWEFTEEKSFVVTYEFHTINSTYIGHNKFIDSVKKISLESFEYNEWINNGYIDKNSYLINDTLIGEQMLPGYALHFSISDGIYNDCLKVTYKGIEVEMVHEYWYRGGCIIFYAPTNDDFVFDYSKPIDMFNDISLKVKEFKFYIGDTTYELVFETVNVKNLGDIELPIGLREVI